MIIMRMWTRLVAVLLLASACVDKHLPLNERSPVKLTAWYSRLSIPANSQVISVNDSYAKVGQGEEMPLQGKVSVELAIPADSIASLIVQARKNGFRAIESASGDTLRALRVNSKRSGLFLFEQGRDLDNQRVVVIDSTKLYMWTYYAQISDKW